MVEYNNSLRFRENRHGKYEIVYQTKPYPIGEARKIEKYVHQFFKLFNAGVGGKETFYTSKTTAIKVVRLAKGRAL